MSVTVVLIAVCVALVATSSTDRAVASAALTATISTYDAPAQHSPRAFTDPGDTTADGHAAAESLGHSSSGFPRLALVFVAAKTAGGALDASELSAGQASNYARYAKKLPSGAQDPVITRGANGSVQFSADVPGRVPGSYATYTKIVDSGGTTTDYYKTTVAPDGSIVHVKIKFP